MSGQAIQVKYLPATNTKGSRLKASCESGSITVNWNYGLEDYENYTMAAQKLKDKMEWNHAVIGDYGVFKGVYYFTLRRKTKASNGYSYNQIASQLDSDREFHSLKVSDSKYINVTSEQVQQIANMFK